MGTQGNVNQATFPIWPVNAAAFCASPRQPAQNNLPAIPHEARLPELRAGRLFIAGCPIRLETADVLDFRPGLCINNAVAAGPVDAEVRTRRPTLSPAWCGLGQRRRTPVLHLGEAFGGPGWSGFLFAGVPGVDFGDGVVVIGAAGRF